MPRYTDREQRNIDTVNALFGAASNPDFDITAMWADDAVWWNGLPLMPGNIGSTEHRGKAAIVALLSGSGQSHPGTGIDSYDLAANTFEDVVVLADEEWVVRQHTMRSTTLGGQSYTNVYCFVFRFNDDGRVAYLTEHWNTWLAHKVLFDNFAVEPAHPLA